MDTSYGRDLFYEESSVSQNFQKGERRYKITHVASIICLIIGIIILLIGINIMPIGTVEGDEQGALQGLKAVSMMLIINGALFLLTWFILFKLKARINVSYDYCFVSGELRISKVINTNKRKLIARFDCAEIIQIGDIENTSYERFKSDPMVKEIVCTSNVEAAADKFFMYILINDNGKKLYLLECREELLVNILKFANRSVLESDYVPQEKKQR